VRRLGALQPKAGALHDAESLSVRGGGARRARMGAAVEARKHIELALKHLEEGKALADEDPARASEKLYKAAEEAVKALALHFGLSDVLEKVERRGRWTVAELEKAASKISGRLGEWFSAAWDRANYLRVWGFHEARLDADSVKERAPDIERMVLEARRILSSE